MATHLGRKKLIRVKNEATPGTAETTDLQVLTYDATMDADDTFQERRAGYYLGHEVGNIGERTGSCSFRAELLGDGTSALDDGVEALLQACGLKLTTGVYAPTSAPASQKTVTIDLFEDGLKKQLKGAMGQVTFEGEYGKNVMCSFTFQGVWVAPTDVALPALSLSAQTPMRLASATWTIGAYSPSVSKFSLATGATLTPIEDITDASGVDYYIITEFDPVFGIDPEADAVATHDFHGIWLAGTEAALALTIGDGSVNVAFAAPKLQYRALKEGDRGGKLINDLTGQLNNSSGDDWLSITPAAA